MMLLLYIGIADNWNHGQEFKNKKFRDYIIKVKLEAQLDQICQHCQNWNPRIGTVNPNSFSKP